MYSVSLRCNDHKKCFERARLGPPDSDCLLHEKPHKRAYKKQTDSQGNSNYADYEFADDAISLEKNDTSSFSTSCNNQYVTKNECNSYVTVNGKEELPCIHKYLLKDMAQKIHIETVSNPYQTPIIKITKKFSNNDKINRNLNGNFNSIAMKNVFGYCTLPKYKEKLTRSKYRLNHCIPPKRITPDGTHIYYWCDMRKKANGGKCIL